MPFQACLGSRDISLISRVLPKERNKKDLVCNTPKRFVSGVMESKTNPCRRRELRGPPRTPLVRHTRATLQPVKLSDSSLHVWRQALEDVIDLVLQTIDPQQLVPTCLTRWRQTDECENGNCPCRQKLVLITSHIPIQGF